MFTGSIARPVEQGGRRVPQVFLLVFTRVDNVQLRDFGASGVRVMVTPHQILERQSKSCYRAYERIVLKSAEHVGTTDSASLAET